MTSNIRGLEEWAEETNSNQKKLGQLKMKAGIGIVSALENWYSQWKATKSRRARDEYMKWRLRLHRKWNERREFLEELDDNFDIGLFDGDIGKTLWDIPPEDKVNLSSGYNWRRDSGNALKGRRREPSDLPDLVQ